MPLKTRKSELTEQLYSIQDSEQLQSIGHELNEVTTGLEEAENRWLELSERAG